MQRGMAVGVEASSLLGPRSGSGQVTSQIVEALVTLDEGVRVVLLPLKIRHGGRARVAAEHPRIEVARSRLPRRIADAVWAKTEWPPVEMFCGAVDVFWGPDYVLPPLLKAAGVLSVNDLSFVRVPELCSDAQLALADDLPRAMRRANRIVVPSRHVADELGDWAPDEASRIRIVHPGVRRIFRERGGPLTPPRRAALGIRDPYAVFVGDLHARKNVDGLLRAFALVRNVHPNAQLVVIGSPSSGWDGVRTRNAKLLATDAVRVVGYLPDAEVAAIVRGARVFVFPSRYEGFGIAPLEAMAAGTPVVAAKTSGLGEALGEHVRWVHPDDIEDIAAATSDHFDGDPDASHVEAARSWATGFRWADAAADMLEVFDEAIRENAA
jgi:glycosyltransferase involved in cell wall biosynthesis